MLIASTPPRILYQSHAGNPADTQVEYQRYVKTQMALMRSRLVMNTALQHGDISKSPLLKSQADPIEWLAKNLQVNREGESEIVEVSLPPGTSLSSKEQATIDNAVVDAYIDEVVNKDRKQMLQRLETLKSLSKSYQEMVKTRRDTIRKLAMTAGSDQDLSTPEKETMPRLFLDLRTRAIDLKLQRVEAEALLHSRTKIEAKSGDQAQKELAQLQDRLTVLEAQQKAVDHEIELLVAQMRKAFDRAIDLDLSDYQEDLKQIQRAADKIGTTLEQLNVELPAPPRTTLVERAEAN